MRLACAVIAIALLLCPIHAAAEPLPTEEPELSDEIARQIDLLGLETWYGYFDSLAEFTGDRAASLEELLLSFSLGETEEPGSLLGILKRLITAELKKAAAPVGLLAGAAMLTALPGILGDKKTGRLASFVLCTSAVTLTAGMFGALCKTALEAVENVGSFAKNTAPIMSTLLTFTGSSASNAAFGPLIVFLSETVLIVLESIVLPIVLCGGVLSMIDAVTEGNRLGELVKLTQRVSGWILGLLTTLFTGAAAIRGFGVASRDGVTVRTAKYALDKLVPIVGGMVSGTVDSVMGCALLVKNGVGSAAIMILLSILARPLAVLGAGVLMFRLAAAVSQPVADRTAVRLLSGAAYMTRHLFACAAAAGCMLAALLFVFIAAGGVAAGLW